MLFWGKKSSATPSKPVMLASDSEISSEFSFHKESPQRESAASSCSDSSSYESTRRQIAANPVRRVESRGGVVSNTPRLARAGSRRLSSQFLSSSLPLAMASTPPSDRGLPSTNGGRRIRYSRQRAVSQRSGSLSPLSMDALGSCLGPSSEVSRVLVLGPLQAGKSTFINAYRAAVTTHDRWPSAPVGICGFHGTTSVEPYPDKLPHPSCLLVDTPGYCYEAGEEALIEKLVEGIPWKTKLVGHNALSLDQLRELTPVVANKCHQCVVVIPASDLVEDVGWTQSLLWLNRYIPASDAQGVVLHVKKLASLLQTLLGNSAAFIVISKMDKIGGCDNRLARKVILDILERCIPINRIFFSEFPVEGGSVRSKLNYLLDSSTGDSLRQLDSELHAALDWMMCMKS